MKRLPIVMLVLAVACGPEEASPEPASPPSEAPAPSEPPVLDDPEAAEPRGAQDPAAQDELAGDDVSAPAAPSPGGTLRRTCAQIEAEYARLTSRAACETDADCHIVTGECGLGLGGCSHAVSTSVSQAAVGELGRAFHDADCHGPSCRCAAPPESARCVSGSCEGAGPAAPSPRHRPAECPQLGCGMPGGCTRMARDANGCPTCRCADRDLGLGLPR